jgi:hypothetical protein
LSKISSEANVTANSIEGVSAVGKDVSDVTDSRIGKDTSNWGMPNEQIVQANASGDTISRFSENKFELGNKVLDNVNKPMAASDIAVKSSEVVTPKIDEVLVGSLAVKVALDEANIERAANIIDKTSEAEEVSKVVGAGDETEIETTVNLFEKSGEGGLESTDAFKTFTNSNDADDWASKAYKDWLNSLNDQEKESIRLYTGPGHYENMNAVLRGIETKYLDNNAEIVEQLTATLNKVNVPESVTLYRGTSQAMLGDLKSLSSEDLVGKIIGDDGFMSASLIPDVAQGTFKGDLTLIINTPAGTQGAYVASLSPYPEVELLLNRGQQMVITEVVKADTSNLVLKVEIIN